MFVAAIATLLMSCPHAWADKQQPRLPELRNLGGVPQLLVDGQPFLVLGGELGNSTASDLAALENALDKCRRLNLNTVLLPVYWDLVEPEEGRFDFSLVRGAIDLARQRDLRLIYLWFGTWKNSMSCYAPDWVKRNTDRFPRVRLNSGEPVEIVSPMCTAANEADAKAFAELMRWTKEYDSEVRTVIMVQVENETGMIPEPRDHSGLSQAAYLSKVPGELMTLASSGQLGPEVEAIWDKAGRKRDGAWADVFGSEPEGEEVFSAWQFSRYVEKVAAAGKREYPLPMFVNAALIRPGYRPNQYPSGGPLPHLLELWRAGAPSLDMLCPDIYFPNFMEWCERYRRGNNPLFIPEMAPSLRASGNVVYAIAEHGAFGCAPFSIESMNKETNRLLASCYEKLGGMSGQILESQLNGTLNGLSPRVAFDWSVDQQPIRSELGGVVLEARFDSPQTRGDAQLTTLPTLGSGQWDAPPGTPLGAVLVIRLPQDEYVILGMGVTMTFSPADGKGKVGIESVQEGQYSKDGTWIGRRWLNGDQTHQGRHVRFESHGWTVQKVTLYRY